MYKIGGILHEMRMIHKMKILMKITKLIPDNKLMRIEPRFNRILLRGARGRGRARKSERMKRRNSKKNKYGS